MGPAVAADAGDTRAADRGELNELRREVAAGTPSALEALRRAEKRKETRRTPIGS
jgi:hypothetical protein